MASMKGRSKAMYDAEPSIQLRNIEDGAETATVAEAAVALGALNGAEWDNGEIPWDSKDGVEVNVHVSAMDTADGDEVYTLAFEVATDEGFTTNSVEVASMVVPAPGAYVERLDPEYIEALATDPRYLRVSLTVAGTTPSITYGAWLT